MNSNALSESTYAALTTWCGAARALWTGKRLHAHLARHGLHRGTFLSSMLILMYTKCGGGPALRLARAVFDSNPTRSAVSWNIMISAYARYGGSCDCGGGKEEALLLYDQMWLDIGLPRPDKFTFLAALSACNRLVEARRIHLHATTSGFASSDTAFCNALLHTYAKCGALSDARAVFDEFPQQRNAVMWNSMISLYAQYGHLNEVLELLFQMGADNMKPTELTFLGILSPFSHSPSVTSTRLIHSAIVAAGLESNAIIKTSLITNYGKCGSLTTLASVFIQTLTTDVVMWNALIAAYARNGLGEDALKVFKQMSLEGITPDRATFLSLFTAFKGSDSSPTICREIYRSAAKNGFESDVAVMNGIISMYGKCGSLDDAWLVFRQTHSRDVISWTAMIAAYVRNSCFAEALELFRCMELERVKPNKITFHSVLQACAGLGSLENGRALHKCIVANDCEADVVVQNSLVNMYGKCGSLKDSRAVFDKMEHHNLITWTSMITAYAQYGHGTEALELFRQMGVEGVKPDRITFLSILDACVSSRMIGTGKFIHKRIAMEGYDSVEISNALVNMYAKCGDLGNARVVFDKMHKRDVISWNSIIGAYIDHGYDKEAFELFQQMASERIKPDKVTFLTILNACSSLVFQDNGKAIHRFIVASGLESDLALRNSLLNMYCKCGSLEEARMFFDSMQSRDAITWNTLIAAYAQNGQAKEAMELVKQMELEGLKPDSVTFLATFNACSHTGLWDVGWAFFISMKDDYALVPLADHYAGLIDICQRAGCLNEALEVQANVPVMSNVSWATLFGASCTTYGDAG